jgi:hypothetical protein
MTTMQTLHINDVGMPRPVGRMWQSLTCDEALTLYCSSGWPVVEHGGAPHLVLGKGFGFAAVRAPSRAVDAISELRESRRIVRGDADIVLVQCDDVLRPTEVTQRLWLPDPENADKRKPKHRPANVDFFVYGEGDRIALPGGNPDLRWRDDSESWFTPMPLDFRNAARTVPVLATGMDGADQPGLAETQGILRPGEVVLIYGPDGGDLRHLLLGAAAQVIEEQRSVVYFDYAGTGKARLAAILRRLGVSDLSRFLYVEPLPEWNERMDLAGLIGPEIGALLVDDQSGLFRASGRTGRSAEHVLPVVMRQRQIAEEHHIAVAVSDRNVDRRPAGAREKLECVNAAWLVRPAAEAPESADRFLRLEGIKNVDDQLAIVRQGRSVSVEFDADEDAIEVSRLKQREQVRAGLLEAVRLRPRRVTPDQLAEMADLPGRRKQRRQIVKELLAEGALVDVEEPRPEGGRSVTRRVLVAKEHL